MEFMIHYNLFLESHWAMIWSVSRSFAEYMSGSVGNDHDEWDHASGAPGRHGGYPKSSSVFIGIFP